MGLVLEFGVRTERRARQRPTRPCEITIFPGVRYERHEEAPRLEPNRLPAVKRPSGDDARR